MAKTSATGITIGDAAPEFDLPDVDGAHHSLSSADAKATVVVFTCNHCPYALAWHDRILDVARDYSDRGVRFFAINSNDGERYPADSYEAMKERLRSESWPLPYLRDESQEVASSYGAKTTPDVFVLDSSGGLRYRGAPDADYNDPAQNASWLRAALDAVLEGHEPEPAETEPVGCTIKWRT
jgi:peroxiredoxin